TSDRGSLSGKAAREVRRVLRVRHGFLCGPHASRTPALLAVGDGAFRELLDGRLAERIEVVGLAARHEALLDDDRLVDPPAAGVADIGAQAPAGRGPP